MVWRSENTDNEETCTKRTAVDGLVLNLWIPPRIHEVNPACHRQIEPDTADTERGQADDGLIVGTELCQRALSLLLRQRTVEPEVVDAARVQRPEDVDWSQHRTANTKSASNKHGHFAQSTSRSARGGGINLRQHVQNGPNTVPKLPYVWMRSSIDVH